MKEKQLMDGWKGWEKKYLEEWARRGSLRACVPEMILCSGWVELCSFIIHHRDRQSLQLSIDPAMMSVTGYYRQMWRQNNDQWKCWGRKKKVFSLPQLNISSHDEVINRLSFPFWSFQILKLLAGNSSIGFPSMFTPGGIYWHAQTVCVAPLPLVRSDEGAKVKPQHGRHWLNQWAPSDWPAGHIYGCGRLIRDHFPGLERQGSRTAAGQHWTPTHGSV